MATKYRNVGPWKWVAMRRGPAESWKRAGYEVRCNATGDVWEVYLPQRVMTNVDAMRAAQECAR